MGSTGDPPVLSGDSPDGTEVTSPNCEDAFFTIVPSDVPFGESPTGTGGSPVLPIFKTRSQAEELKPSQVRRVLDENEKHWPQIWCEVGLVSSAGRRGFRHSWVLADDHPLST